MLWAKATAEGVSKLAAEKLGYEVVGTQAFPTGTSDFSAGLAKARISKAQVIMPIFDMDQSGILPKQWQSMRIPSMLAGFISPMAGPGAWKTFEGKIGGTINVNFELGSAICPVKYEPAMKFCEAYAKKFGVPLEGGHGAAPSYDAVYILAEAIERAGTLDPDKLVEELKKTETRGYRQDQVRRRESGHIRGRSHQDRLCGCRPVDSGREAPHCVSRSRGRRQDLGPGLGQDQVSSFTAVRSRAPGLFMALVTTLLHEPMGRPPSEGFHD